MTRLYQSLSCIQDSQAHNVVVAQTDDDAFISDIRVIRIQIRALSFNITSGSLMRLVYVALMDVLDGKNNAKNYHEQDGGREHDLVCLHDYSPLFSGCMHTDVTTNKTNTNALEKRQIAGNSLKNTLANPTINTPLARSAVSLAINSLRLSPIDIIRKEFIISLNNCQGNLAYAEVMRMLDAGNVGIGTTSPTEKLQVQGSIKLTGQIRQGSLGDMAEMMVLSPYVLDSIPLIPTLSPEGRGSRVRGLGLPRSDDVFAIPEPGDVVAIDETGGIRLSDKPGSSVVIGIISTDPAQILRAELEDAVPVALSGIVPCKVTSENGFIKPGDMLVSSSTPGYAMKAPARPDHGTVIGKALEEQDQEIDMIKVLVMLR